MQIFPFDMNRSPSQLWDVWRIRVYLESKTFGGDNLWEGSRMIQQQGFHQGRKINFLILRSRYHFLLVSSLRANFIKGDDTQVRKASFFSLELSFKAFSMIRSRTIFGWGSLEGESGRRWKELGYSWERKILSVCIYSLTDMNSQILDVWRFGYFFRARHLWGNNLREESRII